MASVTAVLIMFYLRPSHLRTAGTGAHTASEACDVIHIDCRTADNGCELYCEVLGATVAVSHERYHSKIDDHGTTTMTIT